MGKYNNNRISRFIMRLLHFYSLAVGITAISIDFRQRRVHKSRLNAIYAVCVNVLIVVSMPFAMRLSYTYTSTLPHRPIMRIADGVYIVTHCGVILLMMAFRWRRERRHEALMREVFALDELYFDGLAVDAELLQRFNGKFLAKFLTTCGQMAGTAFGMLQITPVVDLRSFLLALYFTNVLYMLHGVVFQYCASLWVICKRTSQLNAQLAAMLRRLQDTHLADALQQQCELAAVQLQLMSQVHWRLTRLVKRLCDNYILQTLAVLLAYILHTIMFGYFFALMLDGSLHLQPSPLCMVFGLLSYFVLFADLYLFFDMCQDTTNAYHSTGQILKQFQVLPFVNKDFERCCERFSLQLMQRRLHIRIGGLFNLNMMTLLALWAFILRHTIILIQSDWEDRFRQMKRNMH